MTTVRVWVASVAMVGLAWGAQPTRAVAAQTCEDKVCAEGARFAPGEKATAKERARRSMRDPGTLSVTIEGGRGSLFVNGRYRGTAPLDDVRLPAGKNDIQVRDGEEVLAEGVLVVNSGATVSLTVNRS